MCSLGNRHVPSSLATTQFLLLAFIYHTHDARYNSYAAKEKETQEESRLLTFLMENYDREVRPVYNASHAVEVKVGITLTQIFDMDEKNQVLTTNVWFDHEWHDELLKWDPEKFGGIDMLRIPCDKIWLPDIVLYNSADDYSKRLFRSLAVVDHNGSVFWAPPTKFRSTCPVNVMYFPFDDQTCHLKLSSWMYDGYKVNVTNRTSDVDLQNYLSNGEWELLDASLGWEKIIYSIGDTPFTHVIVSLKIRRKTLYYMYNIVFPCMMMSTLTVLVFCMPPDSGEKIALGVTVILAFSVFMLAIAERMPETSESIPLIGIYLTFVMAMTTVSVIMTVIVLNFFYRGPNLTEVPPWAKRYIMSGKREKKRTVSTESEDWRSRWKLIAEKYGLDRLKSQLVKGRWRETQRPNGNIPGQSYRPAGLEEEPFTRFQQRADNNTASREAGQEDVVRVVKGVLDGGNGVQSSSHCPKLDIISMDCPRPAVREEEQDQDLVRVVRGLLDKENQQNRDDQIRREWRLLAETVDRWLFWSFFFITTVSTLLFLVILPYSHRGKFF